jgi:hypothetical protein
LPRYQTEIVIPADRFVCLQLPEHLPIGRATVTVVVEEPESEAHALPAELELDRQDIEWWDEFEDGCENVG